MVKGNGEFFLEGEEVQRCAFQKTDLALGTELAKEPGAGASVHPRVWRCGKVLETAL